jgi:UDP-GlcNAc3NAcA epimerase
MKMPEEVNRILTDRISKILFCPTLTAINNLNQEGFKNFDCNIVLSGDVMFDAVNYYQSKIDTYATVIQTQQLEGKPFVLATLHRAENTNDPARLRAICEAFNEINMEVKIVLPLHPRTKAFVESHQIPLHAHIIEPVGYFDMLSLLKNCQLVMTDSGGLQKEAYFFEKFCITLRDQTEWVELVETGANVLAGANKDDIVAHFKASYGRSINIEEGLYGDGHAAATIVSYLR